MARNALITSRDRARTGTMSGGSWTGLTKVQDHNPQNVAESTDALAASTKFDVDLGASYSLGLFLFANLYSSYDATVRLRAGTVADFSSGVVYDSTAVDVVPSDANGKYSSDEWNALGRCRIFIPTAPATARYIRVEITSSVAVQLGVFCACQVVEPSRNLLDFGDPMVIEDLSEVRRVPFGSTYITAVSARVRALDFGSRYLGSSEALTSLFPLAVSAGNSTPLIIAPNPEDTNNLSRTVIYGLLEANQFSNSFFGRYSWVGRIKQLT